MERSNKCLFPKDQCNRTLPGWCLVCDDPNHQSLVHHSYIPQWGISVLHTEYPVTQDTHKLAIKEYTSSEQYFFQMNSLQILALVFINWRYTNLLLQSKLHCKYHNAERQKLNLLLCYLICTTMKSISNKSYKS